MISLRKATENDVELIRDLAKKSWNSAYKKILSQTQIDYMLAEMYSSEIISSQLSNPDYHYYIIEVDSISAGFIGFEIHYQKNTTKLHRIYLLEEFKGKGLGKEALNFMKEKVAESSDSRIILNVNIDNPAKKMYESQGFRVFHKEAFDIGNGFVMDDFLMEFTF